MPFCEGVPRNGQDHFQRRYFQVTRASASAKDKEPPHLGALSAGGMISDGGLNSTTGHETALIKGDRFQRLTGKETIYRVGDYLDGTKGDWVFTLDGNMSETIKKNYTVLVKQDVVETTLGATKLTHTGEMGVIHKEAKKVEEPLEMFHHIMEIFSYTYFHSDNFGIYLLAGGAGTTAFLFNMDLRGIDLGFKAAIGEKHIWEFWEKEEKLDIVLMHQRVSITETFVMAVEPGVGAAMFHEVAVTQEILAVGANQAI